jgi:hypothetical protein
VEPIAPCESRNFRPVAGVGLPKSGPNGSSSSGTEMRSSEMAFFPPKVGRFSVSTVVPDRARTGWDAARRGMRDSNLPAKRFWLLAPISALSDWRGAKNSGWAMLGPSVLGVGGVFDGVSMSMPEDGTIGFSGLLGCRLFSPVPRRPAPSGPGLRLRLWPGTLRIGLSSSTNLSLAVALATPQAGVGLSSIGEDASLYSSFIISIPPRFRFL